LSSNFGKLLERIINMRVIKLIKMSNNQAGGRKGRSTAEHIVLLQEIINNIKKRKKTAYIVFLDVKKAYDKAWLDAILYVLFKEGVDCPEWLLIKKLNERLKATVKTRHGDTDIINIINSIRQGGVLSVVEYAILMDEINKAIENEDLGQFIDYLEEKIGCLLWMDDVLLITCDINEMKKCWT
jgi:hypothetical protein